MRARLARTMRRSMISDYSIWQNTRQYLILLYTQLESADERLPHQYIIYATNKISRNLKSTCVYSKCIIVHSLCVYSNIYIPPMCLYYIIGLCDMVWTVARDQGRSTVISPAKNIIKKKLSHKHRDVLPFIHHRLKTMSTQLCTTLSLFNFKTTHVLVDVRISQVLISDWVIHSEHLDRTITLRRHDCLDDNVWTTTSFIWSWSTVNILQRDRDVTSWMQFVWNAVPAAEVTDVAVQLSKTLPCCYTTDPTTTPSRLWLATKTFATNGLLAWGTVLNWSSKIKCKLALNTWFIGKGKINSYEFILTLLK